MPASMNLRMIVLALLCHLGPGIIDAADPVTIGSGRTVLRFAADGRPQSFRNQDKELLNERDPGVGFELKGVDFQGCRPTAFPFKDLACDGKLLTATIGANIRVTFAVTAADRYIAFRLVRVEGIPTSNLMWLQFRMQTSGTVKTVPLDYMTRAAGHGCEISWPWLWNRREGGKLGGFAVYAPTGDADEDETLLHIWAQEGLAHPRVQGTWDIETARKWLADWQRQFADQSQMLITARSNQELYQLADYATRLDIKRIYMHTDTWRGEYWPVKFSFLHLNPKTFPDGEADFQKFARYARDKGIGLTIHTVSCAIANEDPDYVVGKLDDRLARWTTGTLAQPVNASDKVIAFRPVPGAELPMNIDRPVTGPAHVDPWNSIRTMRLGDEIIRIGSFADTDKAVWLLKDCQRGQFKTKADPHASGTTAIGLIRPYDQCFTADNDSTLVEELGRRMAEFCNRNNIIHCEQDAGEIHTVNHQWGYARFAEAVYTNLDHPVTSNNSGGTPMPCQFEYRFNSSKAVVAARRQPQVPLTLERNGRLATGPYEMCSSLGKAAASGVRSFGIYKPEPMFGVSNEILEGHGLSTLAADTVTAWKAAAPLLDEAQCKAIQASSEQVIHRAVRTAAGLTVTPVQMLSRPGIDIGWRNGSEFGPIVPRQYLRAGERIAVENPFAEQEPEFTIRVMPGFSEGDAPAAAPGTTVAADGAAKDQAIVESYRTGTGVKTDAAAPSGARQGNRLQPRAAAIRELGDHRFEDAGEALRITFDNKRNEAIINEERLPHFPAAADMTTAHGIGLTVTGDGSGAVLLVQVHCRGPRDYVVPLDFKGPRTVVIPCGEVSWTDARWGWKFHTKDSHYGKLGRVSLGLGRVPAKTRVDITVADLRLLPEVPVAVKNPVIQVGRGSLAVNGEIPSGSYAWYTGGDTIGIYDRNWKRLSVLPVAKQDFIVPKGKLSLGIDSADARPGPWLECQFFVKGTPMVLAAPVVK